MSTKRSSEEVTEETGLVVHRRRGRARVEVRRLLGDIDEDCMSVVFRFLPWVETLRIASVCRSWYNTTMTRKAFSGPMVERIGPGYVFPLTRNPMSGVGLELIARGTLDIPSDTPLALNATVICCAKLSNSTRDLARWMRQLESLSVHDKDDNVPLFVAALHNDSKSRLTTLHVNTIAGNAWDGVVFPNLRDLTLRSVTTNTALRFIERHAPSLRYLNLVIGDDASACAILANLVTLHPRASTIIITSTGVHAESTLTEMPTKQTVERRMRGVSSDLEFLSGLVLPTNRHEAQWFMDNVVPLLTKVKSINVEEQLYHNPRPRDADARPSSTLLGLRHLPLLTSMRVTSPYGLDAFDARWYEQPGADGSEVKSASHHAWVKLRELKVRVPGAGALVSYGRMPRLFRFPCLSFFQHDQVINNFAGEDFTELTCDGPAGPRNETFYPRPYILEYMAKVPRSVNDLAVRWGKSPEHLQALLATRAFRRAVFRAANLLSSVHYIGWEEGDTDDEADDDMDNEDDDMDDDDD
jgi:hypothetical protein